jgi:excisionase family DNA binding protein
METINYKKPSTEEQRTASNSYSLLLKHLEQPGDDKKNISIELEGENIPIPKGAMQILAEVLKEYSHGNLVSVYPVFGEISTGEAAKILGCSRPHFVKLLEEGQLNYTLIGNHRKVKVEDVVNYKNKLKARQKKLIMEIMKSDDESGLYENY